LRPYVLHELEQGTRLHSITRHVLGLYAGRAGARAFRRVLSELAPRAGAGWEVLAAARDAADAGRRSGGAPMSASVQP
jgi:tRNA-dihydrouridine synthase A